MRAFLGMGSNLGDSRRLLRDALDALGDQVAGVSPLYETEPVGGPPGQPNYLNVVVELDTDQTPRELLGLARRLEAAAGRERAERWGPRTLDVDILLVGDEELSLAQVSLEEARRLRVVAELLLAERHVPEDARILRQLERALQGVRVPRRR